jgi:FkbM family methyltransferase
MMEHLFPALPVMAAQHAAHSPVYRFLESVAAAHIDALFAQEEPVARSFGPFGSLTFPYRRMGAIDSLDLFGLDELILFSFYWANRRRYHRALDIGANIGLHTILLSRAGFKVDAYEPDGEHYRLLQENLALNHIEEVCAHRAAVSHCSGEAEFVRVLGNTTSSHLAGAKTAYGAVERYTVPVCDIREIIREVDLVKMDVEGHEAVILAALTQEHFARTDILVEIGSPENARSVFDHMRRIGVRLFAQKKGWAEVQAVEEMPVSYKEGTLFLSSKPSMPWS